jgi:hypothetical protein
MKNILVVLFLCSFVKDIFGFVNTNRTESHFKTINADSASVLQKCIDLVELQPFYPKNPDSSYEKLYVMQHGVSFPVSIGVAHLGKPISFLDKEQIKRSGINAYFYFHEFRLEKDAAKVDYVFNYDLSAGTPKMQVVSLLLAKTSQGWIITESNMEAK